MTVESLKGIEASRLARRSARRTFALGLRPGCTGGRRRTRSSSSPRSSRSVRRSRSNRRAFNSGYNATARRRRTSSCSTRCCRRRSASPLPADHRQPGTRVRPDRRVAEVEAAALPRRVPDHASVGDPFSRSSRTTRISACGRSRPRTRSPPSMPRSARASAARSASAPPQAPGWC